MINYKPSHPWRRLPTVDVVAVARRTTSFARYLESLPDIERQKIENAERSFVLKTESVHGTRQAALRDYEEGMVGNMEDHHRLQRGRGLT